MVQSVNRFSSPKAASHNGFAILDADGGETALRTFGGTSGANRTISAGTPMGVVTTHGS